MLRRCRSDPAHVISPIEIEIQPDMRFCGNVTGLKKLHGSPRKLLENNTLTSFLYDNMNV
ncbi:hypothetical protein EPI10_016293 [Gossypium australe]|uniref:Uncharacterized protein n=1 Tax=Gossypium australe TaxID=47621 RepID=A0A5B6VMS8_9ROSI|nr:hypothetical protein EPI10_016293 [Gossypium australe]